MHYCVSLKGGDYRVTAQDPILTHNDKELHDISRNKTCTKANALLAVQRSLSHLFPYPPMTTNLLDGVLLFIKSDDLTLCIIFGGLAFF